MSHRKYPIAAILSLAFFAGITFAQQPQAPSQRFSPERQVPPSVHVPDANAQPLNGGNALRTRSATSMNFSDTPSASFRQPQQNRRAGQQPGEARHVSYTQETELKSPVNKMIPAVLRESSVKKSGNVAKGQFQPPRQPAAKLTPKQFAQPKAAVGGIVVDKTQFSGLHQTTNSNIPPRAAGEPVPSITRIPAMTGNSSTVNQVAYTKRQEADENQVRSADFSAIPKNDRSEPIRRVAAESEMIPRGASMQMSMPAIRVQAFGPEAIGVNKIATYKITVSNDGEEDAKDIQLSIGMPVSVELQNINISTGHHEVADTSDAARLKWNIERLPAGVTHTIALNTIPRSAEAFDMDVEWAFAPQQASTSVRVTEPKLEMKVNGPTEVLFGEKATYDVTIANPGTGTAEQVSVMLPEELGGERANIGDVEAGGEKRFKVELLARTAGQLNLAATAVGEGNIKAEAVHEILVRRASLAVTVEGPPMKYAGGIGQYIVTVANEGDAQAADVAAVLAMPSGVKYLGGIKSIENNQSGGLKWQIGTIRSGERKTYKVNCQLDASGSLVFQAGARGSGDLAATHECQTQVDTIADLTLDVDDPKGPLPTGEDVKYRLVIRNRGTRSANGVDVVMQFAEGIEPVKAEGMKSKIEVTQGQVIFAPISRIEPGQEIILLVTAHGVKSGTHIFRGQLTCAESDSREIDEGTTRFFGEHVSNISEELTLPHKVNTADATSDDVKLNTNDFK